MAKTRKKSLTPAMQQWRDMKDQHPEKVLFFRMGDFYEMFHEDAIKVSELLGLTLTKRGKSDGSVPLAGIPYHQLDRYLKEMIDRGEKVAIVDQLEDPKLAKGVVKRGVTRVVTPGTVLEENCLNSHTNNFLAAVCADGADAGLACVDISTGEFFVSLLDMETLGDELERLSPAETLVPQMSDDAPVAEALKYRAVGVVTKTDADDFDCRSSVEKICKHFQVTTLDGFGIEEKSPVVGAAGAVLRYLESTQQGGMRHIRALRKVERSDHLILDRTTQRNLELTHPLMSGTRSETLLGVLDRTRTGPGGRLLKSWLLRPLATIQPSLQRQDAVGELMQDHGIRAELREHLSGIADMERIMARVITMRANGRDISALARSIRLLPGLADIGSQLRAAKLVDLTGNLDLLQDLADTIQAALVEEPPATLQNGGLIREGFHSELDELKSISHGGKDWIAKFQIEEQERSGIPSLKVGFNKVFGYYIEITHTHREKVPETYIRKQTLVNAERYITPELKAQESKVLGAEERIVSIEYELFLELREKVAREVERVQTVAHALGELDALTALAEVAAVRGFVLPEIHDGLDTVINEGRHPVLETLLPDGEFIPNDVCFEPETARVMIITGPNMAGKSTYIRQVALTVIMAQMGSAVPAASARIGLADRIFTRVGAADDLARGQSTFMVEMAETANILNNATERSLLVLDEVGRGTSTFDGVSLAWAITEFLHNKLGARTMFATHYHELAELGLILDKARNYNVAVRDWGGEIIFLRKIQEGACDRSYGIQVARLAGVPGGVIDRAKEILLGLENQAIDRDNQYLREGEVLRAAAREVQLDLFTKPPPDYSELAEELAAINTDSLSPLQAHQRLDAMVSKVKEMK